MRHVLALLAFLTLLLPVRVAAEDAFPVEYRPTIACRSLGHLTEVLDLAKSRRRAEAKRRFNALHAESKCRFDRIGKVIKFEVVKSYEFSDLLLDHTLDIKVIKATYANKRVRYITIERTFFSGRSA